MRGVAWGLAALAACTFGTPARAQEREPEAAAPPRVVATTTLETSIVTSYVWRGAEFQDDRFEPAVQSYVDLSLAGREGWSGGLGLWSSAPVRDQERITPEVDPYASLAFTRDVVTVALRYWVFVYPAASPPDQGHLFDLTGDVRLGAFTGGLGVSVDPIRAESVYVFARAGVTGTREWLTGFAGVRLGVSDGSGVDLGVQDLTCDAVATAALPRGLYTSLWGRLAWAPRQPGAGGHDWLPAAGLAFGWSG